MIATVTHARVRAAQGDVAGALRVLRSLLTASPGDPEARKLHDALLRPHAAARLRAWIERVRARRGARR
jgi:uncharacterized protein HemY